MRKSYILKWLKKQYFLLAIICLISGTTHLSAQVTLADQNAVNNFPASVKKIKGSLSIGGAFTTSDITNLNALSNVEEIGGDLNITFNGQLNNLKGLSGIKSVGGRIFITNNSNLHSCETILDLIRIGGIIISNNSQGCNSGAEIIAETNRCGGTSNNQDTDGDGVLDCADGCPNNPYKTVNDACGCDGGYAGDSDGDGTIDCFDECPYDKNKIKVGNCGCGKPETPDSDGDGVYDCNDECPNNPYLIRPEICGCEAPVITHVSMEHRTDCDDQDTRDTSDDTYQATVLVEFAWPPKLGAIRFRGATSHRFDFSNDNDSQTTFSFDLVFPADGEKVDFTIEYIGNETCYYRFRESTAQAPCSNLVCDMPTNITPIVDGNQVAIGWDYVADWTSYQYRYRPLGATDWIYQWTDQNALLICDLATNEYYEYGVRAYCGDDRRSEFSQDTFRTASTFTACDLDGLVTDCTIQNIEILDVRRCHDRGTAYQGDDFFFADVLVYYQNVPNEGLLELVGNTTAAVAVDQLKDATTYRFKNLKIEEHFGKMDLMASFSANAACRFNINYPIPLNPCLKGRSRLSIDVEQPISIENDKTLLLYPNPVRDILSIEISKLVEGQLIIFDILGKQVWQQELSDNLDQIDLNIAHFEKGMYHLVVRNKALMSSQKFVKQ